MYSHKMSFCTQNLYLLIEICENGKKNDLKVVPNIPPTLHYSYEHKLRNLNALQGRYQSVYNVLTFYVLVLKYLEDSSKIQI